MGECTETSLRSHGKKAEELIPPFLRLRDGASVAYWVHTPETVGSTPTPAIPISWHDKIEEINASAIGVDEDDDKLESMF